MRLGTWPVTGTCQECWLFPPPCSLHGRCTISSHNEKSVLWMKNKRMNEGSVSSIIQHFSMLKAIIQLLWMGGWAEKGQNKSGRVCGRAEELRFNLEQVPAERILLIQCKYHSLWFKKTNLCFKHKLQTLSQPQPVIGQWNREAADLSAQLCHSAFCQHVAD